jgi:hypothetical protein
VAVPPEPPDSRAGPRLAELGRRLTRAWSRLEGDQRLAGLAALALFASMLLPWYQVSVTAVVEGTPTRSSDSINAFGAFSFVEAAVLLVAAGVLLMLFTRAEGRVYHLPFGDGPVLGAAGVWVGVLVVWRFFDKPGVAATEGTAAAVGVEWGIFVALAAAATLAFAGWRMKATGHDDGAATVDWGVDDFVDTRTVGTAARRRRGGGRAAAVGDDEERTRRRGQRERAASRRARTEDAGGWGEMPELDEPPAWNGADDAAPADRDEPEPGGGPRADAGARRAPRADGREAAGEDRRRRRDGEPREGTDRLS